MKGRLRQKLDIPTILSKVDEYTIYRHYLGFDFSLGHCYKSPFREEKDGSFSIKKLGSGKLHHRDFGGGGNFKGNCFDFVGQLYPGSSFHDILLMIDKDLRLGIVEGREGYKELIRGFRKDSGGNVEKPLTVLPRPLDDKLLSYWRLRGLEKEDLERSDEVKVYGIKYFKIGKLKVTPKDDEICFAYLYGGKYWKIYRPFSEYKWASNVPLKYAYGLNNLSKEHNGLCAKSVKEFFLFLKMYPHVMGVQNESLEAFSEETVVHIAKNCKQMYYGGDCDEPGKKASYAITGAFGYKHVNVPDRYWEDRGIKDFDDWAVYEGDAKVKFYLKRKKII